ncbi:methyltransferase domain protein [Ceratobasidium sp. AG-Ba]|nr:methyltransferase domain protein [Ceratobasidium sp. AG-Ba]
MATQFSHVQFLSLDVVPMIAHAPRPNVAFEVYDFTAGLLLEDESQDAVFLNVVLEMVKDYQGLLREVYRILRPGGLIYIRDLNPHFWDPEDIMIPAHRTNPYGCRFFDLIRQCISSAGIDPDTCDKLPQWLLPGSDLWNQEQAGFKDIHSVIRPFPAYPHDGFSCMNRIEEGIAAYLRQLTTMSLHDMSGLLRDTGMGGKEADELIEVNHLHYSEDEICVLADVRNRDGYVDQARLPSRKNIEKALLWLTEDSKPGDYRFLYVVGRAARRVEKNGFTVEGFMPTDVKFKFFYKCDDCTCEIEDQVYALSSREIVVVHPGTVIWSHEIKAIVAENLADGAVFTAIFDCDAGERTIHDLDSSADSSNQIHFSMSETNYHWAAMRREFINPERPVPSPEGGNYMSLPVQIYSRVRLTTSEPLQYQTIAGNGGFNTTNSPFLLDDFDLDDYACVLHLPKFEVKTFRRNCRVAFISEGYLSAEKRLEDVVDV